MTCPCNRCNKVADPRQCENKECRQWQSWFIEKWNTMRVAPRLDIERRPREMEGVCIGGRYYAMPHRVNRYLHNDPCQTCMCPRDLCVIPCRVKRDWQAAREDIFS